MRSSHLQPVTADPAELAKRPMPRAVFLVCALLLCPAIVWVVFTALLDGGPTAPIAIGVGLLLGCSAVLSFTLGKVWRRPSTEVLLAAIGSAGIAFLIVLLHVVYLSSRGVFD
jgi:hypothetical protein